MDKYKRYLLKRIVLLNSGSLLLLLFTYLTLVFFLSHINSFWEVFRGKDNYEEKDTIPPVSPYLEPIPEATKDNKINITGKAEIGSKILLFLDDIKSTELVTDNEGNFTFSDIQVGLNPTRIKVEAVDANQNVSASSKEYSVVQDIEAPKIEITTPKKGTVHKATERTYNISGITEPQSSVVVNEVLSYSDQEGRFNAQIALRDGGNEIKIKSTDRAGNETEEKTFMTFEKIE